MSWSGLQREALEAMGFAVLMPRPAPGDPGRIASDAPAVAESRAGAAAHAAPVASPPPAERGSGPSAAAHAATAVPPRAEPRRLASPQDRLAHALLRAAGRPHDAADAAALLAQWPDPAHLRRDPAAKRALWPRLRALRRADA